MLQYLSWANIHTGLNSLQVVDEPILDPVLLYHSICKFRFVPSVKKIRYLSLFIFSEFLTKLESLYIYIYVKKVQGTSFGIILHTLTARR